MGNVVLPIIIQGPARLKLGSGPVIYVKQDIAVNQSAESWNPETAWGPLGERHKSRKDVISATPVGMIKTALLDWYFAAFLNPANVGASIMAGALAIDSLAENITYNWGRAGLSKPPNLSLKPSSTAYGALEITAIGDMTKQPTNATFWKPAQGVPGADTSFEEDNIISDVYGAALGSRSAPYNGMGGMDGFDVSFNMMLKEIANSDVGIADIILAGLGTSVSFAPSNLTEAQVDTLCAIQDTGAVLPGQAYSKAKEDLVITGANMGWVFKCKNMGAKRSDRVYAIGEHRHRLIEFVNGRTWTTGAPDKVFDYTAGS